MLKCISKTNAEKLREGIKTGDFDIAKMFDMTTKERRGVFEKYVDGEASEFLNTAFEKAMNSSRIDALKDWAEKTFKGESKSKQKDITEKIDALKETGLLTGEAQDQFVEDLLKDKLGFFLTAEETAPIIKMSDRLQELAKEESEFGTPTEEYLEQREKLMNYIDSLNPSSKTKVLTSVIGRLTLLFSFKSPITNIVGNTINGLNESAVRRMADNNYSGLKDPMFEKYRKFASRVYKNTGYDLSRMHSLTADQRIAGEQLITSQGKGNIRKVGRIYENGYKYIMGIPDNFYANIHFTDVISLGSMKLARKTGITDKEQIENKAREIARDAMRIEPLTNDGKLLREQAIAGAEYGTYTDKNFAAKVSKGFRSLLNTATGSVRLGDLNIPFAHIPATIVQRGIESSGITSLYDGFKLAQAFKNGDTASTKKYSTLLIRAGWGMLVAQILVSLIDPDDFIGEYADYDTNERKLIESGQATYNSLKIGNKYVSLDYLTPFAPAIIGILNAKKYGKGGLDSIVKYYTGATSFVTRIPGYEQVAQFFGPADERGTLKNYIQRYKKENIDYQKEAQDAALGLVDFVSSRIVPALIYDFAKAMDDYERQVDYSGPQSILQKIQAKIPVLREQLPKKVDMFGEPLKAQNPLSTLFAGARFKEGRENDVLNELNRLASQSMLPSLTDIQYTSSRVKELKQQIGDDKFKEALTYFSTNWYEDVDKEIHRWKYQSLNDEDKKKLLNNLRSELLDKTLKKYGYRKPKK